MSRLKAVLIGLLVLAAYVLAGTSDLADEQVEARVTAEIVASAPGWAVTR